MTNEKRFENWLNTEKGKTVEQYKALAESTQKKYISAFKAWVLADATARAEAKEETTEAATEQPEQPKETTEQPEEKKAKKEKRKTVADIATGILTDVNPDLYTVDKKGRYKFEGFFITFKTKGTQIRFAPGKKFRENHLDITWENHPGWDNEFTTDVTRDFLLKAIAEIEAKKSAEAE